MTWMSHRIVITPNCPNGHKETIHVGVELEQAFQFYFGFIIRLHCCFNVHSTAPDQTVQLQQWSDDAPIPDSIYSSKPFRFHQPMSNLVCLFYSLVMHQCPDVLPCSNILLVGVGSSLSTPLSNRCPCLDWGRPHTPTVPRSRMAADQREVASINMAMHLFPFCNVICTIWSKEERERERGKHICAQSFHIKVGSHEKTRFAC